MATQSLEIANEDIKSRVDAYLDGQSELDVLRFITCGSVDDGKSTLIGRMLFEAQLIAEDQVAALGADSRRHGTQGDDFDFALLVDGLAAEREQGITIDVAYRFFATDHRKFIVADTPGHEQYTRNMVTGASTAQVAVILMDARKGVLTQTRRHSFIASLLGIRHVVLAVNKMDLVDYDEATYDTIVADYERLVASFGFSSITPIPLSALRGDNVIERSPLTAWYSGPTLLGYLETVDVGSDLEARPFRMPVQWVNRPNAAYRGYAGTLVAGIVRPGDAVRALPSGETARVASIDLFGEHLESARAEQAVTLTLDRDIDLSRGDVLTAAEAPCEVSDQFDVTLVWMGDEPGFVGRSYRLLLGTSELNATIRELKHVTNVNTFEELSATRFELNDIGRANLSFDRPIPFEPFAGCRDLGAFVLVDRYSNATVAAGMINFSLRRATNVVRQAHTIDRNARARLMGHRGRVLWFTGLSGSGKSTVSDALELALHGRGVHTYLLDGDNVRQGLNKDLGFTDADRVENVRRIAEVAKLMADAGLVVLTAFISPFRSERDMARSLFEPGDFLEIHCDVPLEVAESRDPKGLYRKARRGELPNFTGIDSVYEVPEAPELVLRTHEQSVEACVEAVLKLL